MKVLIDDGLRIQLGTGIGNYCLYLYKSLKNKNCNVELSDYKATSQNRKLKRLQYILYINGKKFRKKVVKYDIIHFAGQFMPLKKIKGVKYVVTVHDLTSFIHPETMSFLTALTSRQKIKRIMKKADAIVTVSNSVKKEMQEYFPEYSEKVTPIYPGNYDNVKRIENVDQYDNENLKNIGNSPFFLFVGTIEKRKNVGLIIDSFIRLKEKSEVSQEYKLVLAGRPGFGYEEFFNVAQASKFSQDIIFTGYTSNDDCSRLYCRAAAYIFPTVYEGFGSTQLECMYCHTPIILSDIPTNREISKKYGLFFSLESIDSLVEQMMVIVNGKYDYAKHNRLADEYLKNFDWDDIADEYVKLYEEIENKK